MLYGFPPVSVCFAELGTFLLGHSDLAAGWLLLAICFIYAHIRERCKFTKLPSSWPDPGLKITKELVGGPLNYKNYQKLIKLKNIYIS